MKLVGLNALLIAALLFASCGVTQSQNKEKIEDLEVTGCIEITSYDKLNTGEKLCSVVGTFVDENGDPAVGMKIYIKDPIIGVLSDIDGKFDLKNIPPGTQTIVFEMVGGEQSTITLELISGDEVTLEGIYSMLTKVELLKPIIYLYPEKQTDVHIELNYDGKLTTTYPTYPVNGWNVIAHPDGTIFDRNGREYYSLYWEGEPREPLKITDGFVVPKEETIEFLEEKLELLGLNAREANEFIIFWLPILQKNNFNVIHFAEEDYLEQAQLTVTPEPETMIRIAMVFQGSDEFIEIPQQDLASLKKKRKGFTLVEWGGQELPKMAARGI